MPVKIRLQRHGKKGYPIYWIVAADARASRDGRFLEKLGTYNPNTNPASIELDVDGSVKWLQNGAQPTDTAKTLLSQKGVLLKKHLAGGVSKGALTEEQAEEKFQAWLADKEGRTDKEKEDLLNEAKAAKEKALAAEKEVNQKRIDAAAEKAKEEAEALEAEVKAAADANAEAGEGEAPTEA